MAKKKRRGARLLGLLAIVLLGVWAYRSLSTGDEGGGGEAGNPAGIAGEAEGDAGKMHDLSVDPNAKLPRYEVLDRKVYDAPIKTQVQLDLLVSGELTPASLRALLTKLFLKTDKERGFRYHYHPTHVFMYAYSDRERAKSGMGSWVAMLSKVGEGERPHINVNEKLLAVLKRKPVVKFGLTEEQRKGIFKDVVRAEDRSMKEADAKYPLEPHKAVQVGQELGLTERTALMPWHEARGPSGGLEKIRHIQAGSRIRILRVQKKKFGPWYEVNVFDGSGRALGSGWINSMALFRQIKVNGPEVLGKQADYSRKLKAGYDADIAKRHGLSAEQLEAISVEGLEKQWPMPRMPE